MKSCNLYDARAVNMHQKKPLGNKFLNFLLFLIFNIFLWFTSIVYLPFPYC